MTPDLAEFILQTPEAERRGRVFKVSTSTNKVGRTVSAIGKRAGVVVNKADDKFASAHDLRRAFGTRWASRVKPATLQLLMRHRQIETTMRYYVDQDADDVADQLWKSHGVGTSVGTAQNDTGEQPDLQSGAKEKPVVLQRVSEAEGTGLEPATRKRAPDFESDATCQETREKTPVSDSCQQIASSGDENDADLALILAAWPELPDAIKAGILAMVKSTTQQ